jgi:signal transduction histidine kinase/CHASE2 domain-containing sensor protein
MRRIGLNPKVDGAFSFWRWARLNLVLLVLTGLINLIFPFPVMRLNHWLGDSYLRLRRVQPTSKNVAMVLIDDAALAQYGRWPWPRERLARVVRAVSRFHPKAIGIDILLSEPEDQANDAALEAAIREAGNVVLQSKISSSLKHGLWVDPLPRFASVAAGIGHAQTAADSDGVCRKIPTIEPSTDGPRPAFAVAIASLVDGGQAKRQTKGGIVPSTPSAGFERLESSYLTINYLQQFSATETNPPFVTLSAVDVLDGNRGASLEGKVVVIGSDATELSDRLFTPVSDQTPMPGVEVNANAIDTLLEHRQIESFATSIQRLLLLCTGMISLWLVIRWPGTRGLLCLAALVFGEYLAGYFALTTFHRQLEYGPLLMAGVLAAPLAQLESLFVVDRAVTRRLKELQQLPRVSGGPVPRKVFVPNWGLSPSRLHWKLDSLRRLEDELGSLYTFDETLLEGMQEALAVVDLDGNVLFHNSSWKLFCEEHGLEAKSNLKEAAPALGLAADLSRLSLDPKARLEKEILLGATSWRLRGMQLPWPSAAEPNATLLLGEDISARRERDRARAETIGFVTHELRTPLIAIQGFAELMMRYPQQVSTSDAPATIFRESRRLVAMINAYLEVLRMDVGARPLRMKPVEIGGMVHHVEQILQPLAQSAQIQIYTEVDSQAQTLECDEPLVTGALLNLMSNAVKYSPSGSMVKLQVSIKNGDVEFQMRNPGPVIAPENLEHVFEPYYRIAGQSGDKPGWGLGLAFVKRISEQHGGSVQATSSASSGTCFSLVLPLHSNSAAEAMV